MEPESRVRRLASLIERGVTAPAPEQVYLGAEVDLERIAPTAVLHPGTRLEGARTLVGPGVSLGAEGPVGKKPGAMALTVMPSGPKRRESTRVIWWTAALLAE